MYNPFENEGMQRHMRDDMKSFVEKQRLASRRQKSSCSRCHNNGDMILPCSAHHRGSIGASRFSNAILAIYQNATANCAGRRGAVRPNLTKYPADARLISSSPCCQPERLRLPWINVVYLKQHCVLLSVCRDAHSLQIHAARESSRAVAGLLWRCLRMTVLQRIELQSIRCKARTALGN